MAQTRLPHDRAEILDELLSTGRWRGPELLQKLNDRLSDKDGKTINKRTLTRDLEYLEAKGAPLHRPKKGEMVYYYEHPLFSKRLTSRS